MERVRSFTIHKISLHARRTLMRMRFVCSAPEAVCCVLYGPFYSRRYTPYVFPLFFRFFLPFSFSSIFNSYCECVHLCVTASLICLNFVFLVTSIRRRHGYPPSTIGMAAASNCKARRSTVHQQQGLHCLTVGRQPPTETDGPTLSSQFLLLFLTSLNLIFFFK